MKKIDISKPFYAMASAGEDTVEVTMYGDVVESRPIDWWTDEPIPGDYIILDEFLADLGRISKAKNIHLRINSYGGDCVTAFVIHNRLRELAGHGANISCTIDGVAMSAASIIMSACDHVKVNPASLVMVHKCWSFIWGGYNADELNQMAEQATAYDKAICAAYVRKTGLSETVIMHMMSETTYLTGKEAVEKGFADEVIEDAEPLNLAASADGRAIYCRGQKFHLAPGMFAPDSIPTIEDTAVITEQSDDNTNSPVDSGSTEGGSPMNKDELMANYPELVAEIQAEANAGMQTAVSDAVRVEQERIRQIDEVASLFTDELVAEAKYGDNVCTAEQLAYRAALRAKQQGTAFLAQVAEDSEESGTEDVGAAPAPEEKPEEAMTEAEKQAQADGFFASLLK